MKYMWVPALAGTGGLKPAPTSVVRKAGIGEQSTNSLVIPMDFVFMLPVQSERLLFMVFFNWGLL